MQAYALPLLVISHPVRAARLVGRTAERTFFDERLTLAERGSGAVLILLGEAGFGKTRLLHEWMDMANARGLLCALGENFEHQRAAFAPIGEVFASLLEHEGGALPATSQAQKLMRRFASAEEPFADGDAGSRPWQKQRLFVVAAETLQRAAQSRPVLLCVDDAQWADPESRELLAFLASRIERTRALIVIASRPVLPTAGDSLATTVAQLERLPWAHRILLGPLSETETRALIRSALGADHSIPSRTVDEICRRSEGIPLFAEGLLREALHPASVNGSALPSTVAQAVERQLLALTIGDAVFLETASALGVTIDAQFVSEVTGANLDMVTHALRAGRDAGLLVVDANSGTMRFRHQLVRDAVYERMIPEEQRSLHGRIAKALEHADDVSFGALAQHWKAAGDAAKTAWYAIRAGDEALRRYGFATARDHFEAALAAGLKGSERAVVQLRLGIAYNLAGDASEAYRCFEEALASFRELGLKDEVPTILLHLATAAQRKYDTESALRHAREALAEAKPGSRFEFMANASVAFSLTIEYRIEEARPFLEAAEDFTGQRDGPNVVRMHLARAVTAFYRGNVPGWEASADAAVQAAEAYGDPTPLVFALLNMGVLASEVGKFDLAVERAERVRTIADEYGLGYHSALARLELAELGLLRGDLGAAASALRDAEVVAVDANAFRIRSAHVGIRVGLATGDESLIAEFASPETLELAFTSQSEGGFGLLGAAHAELAARRKDLRAAARIVGRVLDKVETVQWIIEELPALVRLASDEDLPRLERLFAQKYHETPSSRAGRLLAEARLAERRGKRRRAQTLARESANEARRLQRPLDEARALEMLGERDAALAIYERLAANGEVARLDAEVRSRGLAGVALTKREREIERLALGRRSNREIADELGLSVRTVEHHVASILAKRSLKSRAELGRGPAAGEAES